MPCGTSQRRIPEGVLDEGEGGGASLMKRGRVEARPPPSLVAFPSPSSLQCRQNNRHCHLEACALVLGGNLEGEGGRGGVRDGA